LKYHKSTGKMIKNLRLVTKKLRLVTGLLFYFRRRVTIQVINQSQINIYNQPKTKKTRKNKKNKKSLKNHLTNKNHSGIFQARKQRRFGEIQGAFSFCLKPFQGMRNLELVSI